MGSKPGVLDLKRTSPQDRNWRVGATKTGRETRPEGGFCGFLRSVPGAAGALHVAAVIGALLIAAGADVERTNDLNGDNALGWTEYFTHRNGGRRASACPGSFEFYVAGVGSRDLLFLKSVP